MTLDFGKSYAKPNSAHSDLQDDVCKYWRAKGWIPVKELGLGSRSMDKEVKRADVFAMSETYPPRFIICEVKVSRADFLRGIKEETYLHYMEYCNYFYFATPSELLLAEDIPLGCGWLESWDSKYHVRRQIRERIAVEEDRTFKMNDLIWHSFVKRLDK